MSPQTLEDFPWVGRCKSLRDRRVWPLAPQRWELAWGCKLALWEARTQGAIASFKNQIKCPGLDNRVHWFQILWSQRWNTGHPGWKQCGIWREAEPPAAHWCLEARGSQTAKVGLCLRCSTHKVFRELAPCLCRGAKEKAVIWAALLGHLRCAEHAVINPLLPSARAASLPFSTAFYFFTCQTP